MLTSFESDTMYLIFMSVFCSATTNAKRDISQSLQVSCNMADPKYNLLTASFRPLLAHPTYLVEIEKLQFGGARLDPIRVLFLGVLLG